MIETTRYQIPDRDTFRLGDWLLRWEVVLLFLVVAVVVFNATTSPYFLDLDNISDMTQNFSEQAIVALGMTLLILIREIDLSVAATIALASLAIGYTAELGGGVIALFGVGLLVGAACGVLNGGLVVMLRLPSIVVTIGTMSLYRGIAQVALGDTAITRYSSNFTDLGQLYLFKMPPVYLSFLIFLILAAVFAVVLHFTTWGRMLYAIGSNPVAARFTGIRCRRIRFLLFMLTGLLAGLAAALLTARIGSTRPNIALGWELEIITMVVLGGVSISGGSGTIGGVMIAVFLLGLLTFGLTLLNVPSPVVNVIVGMLLVAAIGLPIMARRVLMTRRRS